MNMQVAHTTPQAAEFDHTKPARALLARTGIQELLDTPGITEVAFNKPHELWFEKGAVWYCKEAPTLTYQVCAQLAHSLAVQMANNSSQLQENPICPVWLPDGERGQIVMPPATMKGCISFTIRKPSQTRFTIDEFEESGRFDKAVVVTKKTDIDDHEKEMVTCLKRREFKKFFQLAVKHKLNLMIGGQTGSGKTTFSKSIVDLYPPERRYVTIEDVHELTMPNHPNRVHLLFNDKVEPKDIIKACMRMKPDHIFMAELKGEETWSYLNALNTGHNGSIATAHFSDCNGGATRLADIVAESKIGANLEYNFILNKVKEQIDCYSMWEGTYMTEIKYDPEEKLSLRSGA